MIRPIRKALDPDELFNRFRRGFQKSRKGNYWREYDGAIVVLFRGRDEGWNWLVIHPDKSKQFGSDEYDSRNDAMLEAWEAVR
ncbi:MAG: hypothetical protein RIC55_28385 [Pirellulaceae bacterium]